MSRSNLERASSKRSKMDRYTEDLKYSLRRRLSESVSKGTLRTDDILARNHRQIVADFTDPRQWYYSATHDYIIALMRESQKQNGGSVWRDGSRKGERGSSRGHTSSTTKDGRQGRHKGSFIEIPTTTSEDLQEIRGLAEKPPDFIVQDQHVQSDMGVDLQGDASLAQTPISKDTTDNNDDVKIALDCYVPSNNSPEGKSNIAIKQEATIPLLVNNDQNFSVLSRDCPGSHIPVKNYYFEKSSEHHPDVNSKVPTDSSIGDSQEGILIAEEYNVVAMEAYRASKQSQQSQTSSKKQKGSAHHGNSHDSYFPGKMESFIPVGKRSKTRPTLNTAISLPQIGKTFQTEHTEQREFQRTKLYKVRRGRVGSRKRRLCPLMGLERASDRKDLPYVEDWIQKLQITEKDIVGDKREEPIERIDETFPYMPQQRPHMATAVYQQMELPSDFKPVTGFQQFQPLPSLYLYSLKQKSDLNVKFNHFDMLKLDKEKTDPGNQQKHSLKEELTQARSRVNFIENRLEKLYRGETNLDRIVSRQHIKSPSKKQNGRFIDITVGITKRIPVTNSSQERSVDNYSAGVPTAMDHNKFPKVSDGSVEGQSKINTISLSLSANERTQTRGVGPSTPESKSMTQGDDFHLSSTSSWKHPNLVTSGREKSGKVLEGKTLFVFDNHGVESDDLLADQTDTSLINDPDMAIASVQDCNASGPEMDLKKQARHENKTGNEELNEDKTDSMLSAVVLEVLNDLMDHLEVPDEINEQPTSTTNVGASHTTEEITVTTAKETSVLEESPSVIGEDGSQTQRNITRLCSFCDEPHEIT